MNQGRYLQHQGPENRRINNSAALAFSFLLDMHGAGAITPARYNAMHHHSGANDGDPAKFSRLAWIQANGLGSMKSPHFAMQLDGLHFGTLPAHVGADHSGPQEQRVATLQEQDSRTMECQRFRGN